VNWEGVGVGAFSDLVKQIWLTGSLDSNLKGAVRGLVYESEGSIARIHKCDCLGSKVEGHRRDS
jgi:hypothetical protein